jgi:small subunit ribosomal protein S4
MARYTGSKTKLSKRVGRNLFLKGARSFSAKDDFTKKATQRPGVHGAKRVRKVSEYGKQLQEKQILKYSYGILEKQLANIFKKAFRKKGETSFNALMSLECRLDNIVYRAGLANSRAQARQLVAHGHFTVNGKKVNIPSYTVKAGEQIAVKENKLKNPFWTSFKLEVPNQVPSWLDTSSKNQVKILHLPLETDLPKDFKLPYIVEYYSRKVA